MSLIIIWEEIILNDVKLKDLYMGLPDGEVEARDKRFQELFFDPNKKILPQKDADMLARELEKLIFLNIL